MFYFFEECVSLLRFIEFYKFNNRKICNKRKKNKLTDYANYNISPHVAIDMK